MELLLLLRLNCCCSLGLGVAVDALKVDDDATLGVTMLVATEEGMMLGWRDDDGGTFEYKLVLED